MTPLPTLALSFALGAALTATPARAAPPTGLPAPVAQALQQAGLPADALAAVVLPADGARWPAPRWAHQDQRPMQPASTMKLLTTVVALDQLGPNLRGHTELWSRAPVLPGPAAAPGDGVLQGDLLLRGGADPELALPQLGALLAELRWQGIATLAGDIVLDRSLFRPGRIDRGLPPFDAWPEFPYNNLPDAAQIHDSLVGLEIRSDGQQVKARLLPPLPGLAVDASALQLTDRACKDWDDDWQSPPLLRDDGQGGLTVQLRGGFPRHCVQRPHLALLDRDLLAERQLRGVWQSLGGQWTGRLREATEAEARQLPPRRLADPLANLQRPGAGGTAGATAVPAPSSASPSASPSTSPTASSPPSTPAMPAMSTPSPAPTAERADGLPAPRLLARRQSRPWGELLRTMNKQSDNLLTRLLFLQLGVNAMAAEPEAPTRDLADRAVRRWLAAQRIDAPGLVLDNGSGLSRSERISPRTLAQALQAAYKSRWAPELLMGLPLVGVDGTMRNRLRASPAGGWARLKTGTLKNTTALAGIVPDRRGRPWVLVAMVNHERAADGRPALDALVDWVARGGLTSPGPLPDGD